MQIPADRALRGLSPRAALILSTVAAAAGLLTLFRVRVFGFATGVSILADGVSICCGAACFAGFFAACLVTLPAGFFELFFAAFFAAFFTVFLAVFLTVFLAFLPTTRVAFFTRFFAAVLVAARFVAEGVPIENLLAVTFTRIATAELRDRVRARLVRRCRM